MANISAPGVEVRVINESITVPSSGATTPLIVAATHRNKQNPSGAIATSTTADTAGSVTQINGRGDLLEFFGRPHFETIGGTVRQGYETNEYGLHAAWQALGIANTVHVLTADVDLAELKPQNSEPTRPPESGTHWLDLNNIQVGLFKWNKNANSWEEQEVEILNDKPGNGNVQPMANGIANPRNSYGQDGDYVIVTSITPIVVYEKLGGQWHMLGSETHPKDFQFNPHTRIPKLRSDGSPLEDGDLFVKTTVPNNGSYYDVSTYNSDNGQFITKDAPLFVMNDAATEYYENINSLEEGMIYVQFDNENHLNPDFSYNKSRPRESDGVAVFTIRRYNGYSNTTAVSSLDIPDIDLNNYPTSKILINDVEFTFDISTSSDGSVITAKDIGQTLQSSSELKNLGIRVELTSENKRIRLINRKGRDITVQNVGKVNVDWEPNTMSDVASVLGFGYNINSGEQIFRKTNWEPLEYEASYNEPVRKPEQGSLWYNNDLRAELLESYYDSNDDSVKWRTHSWSEGNGSNTNNNLWIRGTEPSNPNDGDVWIDSSDLENYPIIHQYRDGNWVTLDNTDQTTTEGVIFSNYSAHPPFDEDGNERSESAVRSDLVPNPENYPEGILLFNMDYSTGNVKEYQDTGEWLSVSGNRPDGSPYMGRKAQRRIVVRAMKQALQNSKAVRARERYFNIFTATGYPELLPDLNSLNQQRKRTGFVIGSSPMRLEDDGNAVYNWANNTNDALENGEEGLVSMDNMSAVWGLAGFQSNADGFNVAVPSDVMALQVLLQNDRQAYPWFAPAGDRRGLIPNTTSIGFVTNSYQFEAAEMNDGLIETMYENNINPIYDDGGIKAMGQKTLTNVSSAMDRINVARLVAYLRYMLPRITRPFIFQPNDSQTRQAATNVVEKFLADIVEKRGISDFAVVCDSSNNTPARIEQNELWIDVSINPIYSVEFIVIPVRLQGAS
ncbi:tail sheath subunit [Salicola phage SCTP-2]|nr:tail sheath subunit [Salicola phage SCTP-2]